MLELMAPAKQKGDTALGKAISYFLSQSYEVCLPIGDKRSYDLIIERQGQMNRVQVKHGGLYSGKSKCLVALRVMGGNQSYSSAKKYGADDFEYLFVHTAKGESYLLPWDDLIVGKSVLSIEADKYCSFKLNMQG